MLCGTRLEITVPSDEQPDEGLIGTLSPIKDEQTCNISCCTVPNIDLLPMSSPYHKSGPPREDAQCYAHILASLFEKNRVLDKRTLLIESAKACWVLYIDLYCLVDAGNVFDAAILALSAVLDGRMIVFLYSRERVLALDCSLVMLSRVTFDEEAGAVQLDADQSKLIPLENVNLPLAASFGIAEM